MGDTPMPGGTALLRVAGMPLAAWAAAGGPDLFARLTEHARDGERRAGRARALAAELGDIVVPRPELTAADRRAVLALRRRLHSGAAPRPADCRLLEGLAVAGDLAEEAVRLCRDAASADEDLRELERAVAAERARVGELGWSLVCAAPVMRAFLDEAAPGVCADVVRRLAEGESWHGQRLRKRGAYLWRALGRAAAKTTPRGWAGQVVPLPVAPTTGDAGTGDGGATPLIPPGTALGALAAEAVENVHLVRGRLGGLDLRAADPATFLAPAPLHFLDPPGDGADTGTGVLRCWVIDPGGRDRMRQVVLRRTRPLDAVLRQFADGPRELGDIETALLGTAAIRAADPGPAVLRGFLAHLVELGVLQVCAAPRRRSTEWVSPETVRAHDTLPRPVPARADPHQVRPPAPGAVPADDGPPTVSPSAPAQAPEPWEHSPPARPARDAGPASGARVGDAETWFIDSYRTVSAAVPRKAAERVQRGLAIAARVAWLRDADRLPAPRERVRLPETAALDERPRPLGEILARTLPDGAAPPSPPRTAHRYAGWHPARTAGSGYARLLAHLAAHTGEEQVDLDDTLLDALDAPPARTALPAWPLDCLLRPLPGPGPVAVLETASPAGILDARFAAALHTLYGSYDGPDGYRAFLTGVERLTGARFVELLVPPLAERAANAVRRPVVTDRWTGDPDPAPYQGPAGSAARIPVLAALLHDVGGPGSAGTASRAVAVWARTAGQGPGHCGLYDGGLAGTLVGLRTGARLHPRLHVAADRLRDQLVRIAPARGWRREQVSFPDYDVIIGPSGILLALCVGTEPEPAGLEPFADHVAALCDADELPRLRTAGYAGHPRLGWLDGRVNTGMGHGAAGVVAALTAAVRHLGPRPGPTRALRRATRWLTRQSFVDARYVRTWDGAGLDGPPPTGARARQAWCYGTPGVSWALWDAADALGDPASAAWAAEAFTTLAERYDETFHLFGDRPADVLALCHGAAGVLAVADAFDHHAHLPAAAALKARLLARLLARLPELSALGQESRGLLGGASGALCALLTAAHGAPRTWLPCLGLR
ncbi:lanthionine synthetase LanC family protein [Streptomyces sp. NPDC048665]|uniref:lanthionine synthetase LanC family protein n=1 Tax=Streptomyces sp. NPDC048665 TaxID=3155490 RepID=UPI00341BA825